MFTMLKDFLSPSNLSTDPTYKKIFYKITNYNENHNGFQYKDGLNIDTKPFMQDDLCSNGLYFYDIENLWRFKHRGVNIREITIPNDTVYIKESFDNTHKYKANKIILGKKMEFGSDEFNKLLKNTSYENNKWVSNYLCKYNDIENLDFCLKYNYLDSFGDINDNTNNMDIDDIDDINNMDIDDNYIRNYKSAFKMAFIKKYYLNNNKLNELFEILTKNTPINIKNIINSNINHSNKFYINFKEFTELMELNIYELINKSFLTRDYTFIKYLKEYHIPKLIEQNKTNNLHFFGNILNKIPTIDEINKNFSLELTEKLKIHDINQFNKILIDNQACVSGSFLINSFITKKYKPNDIDIYIKPNFLLTFFENFKSLLYYNYNPVITIDKSPKIYSYLIKDSYNIKLKNDVTINLIVLEDPILFLDKYSDFNFTKCIYNGNQIHFKFDINTIMKNASINDEYINYYFNIYHNDDTIYPLIGTLNRIIKYTERGFLINNYKDFIEKIELLLI